MSVRIRWCVVLQVFASIGCRSDAPPRRPLPPPAASTILLPDDALAVVDIDIPKLRASALWHFVRRAVEEESSIASMCPGVLGDARSATLALRMREDTDSLAVLTIVHGVDRASTVACLQAPRRDRLASASPLPSDLRPLACQRLDDAIHGLARCGEVPESLAGELDRARTQLAAASSDDLDAGCTRALAVAERVTARRAELGWSCEPPERRGRQERTGEVKQLDPSTFSLDGIELVQFRDDATMVIVHEAMRAYDVLNGHGVPAAQADLRALQGARPAPRWYDASRATRDPARAIWLAADPARLLTGRSRAQSDGLGPLPRISGTIDVARDAILDLQLVGLTYGHAHEYSSITHIADDPMFHGVAMAAACAGPAPGGPRADACARAIAHRHELNRGPAAGPGAVNPLLDQVVTDDAVRDCVDRPWPDRQLACVNAAQTAEAARACDPTTLLATTPIACGGHPVGLRIALPLLLVESLKLYEVTDRHARSDCQQPDAVLPDSIVVGPAQPFDGDAWPLAATPCWGYLCGPTIDLAATHTGHNDSRWLDLASHGPEPCVGPFHQGVTGWGAEVHKCNGPTVMLQVTPDGAKLCRGACAKLSSRGPYQELSTDLDARYAALVVGAPGAQWVETWDLATHKRLGRFAPGTTRQRPCVHAQLLGDTVLVDTDDCKPPDPSARAHPVAAAGAFLATLQGRRIAAVGGDHPLATLRHGAVPTTGRRWVFVASQGDAVVIQDVATGAVERRIATGEPVESGMVTAGADALGHVVLAFGGATARAGGVTVIDAASGTARAIPARTTCPADAAAP